MKLKLFFMGMLYLVAISIELSCVGCLKLQSKNQNNASAVTQELQIKSQNLTPVAMKMCHRPAHYMGLKKCQRTGKWVQTVLSAVNVDNDRSDVFTEPGMSLLKQNFYSDTFSYQGGASQFLDYPDQYRVSVRYAQAVSFQFAIPTTETLPLNFNYWGRDESFSTQIKPDQIGNLPLKSVKIQHWNDGSTFKKFATLSFSYIGDYNEINYRLQCQNLEKEIGYDYQQAQTKEGYTNIKIPETVIWRKITESCDTLNLTSENEKNLYLHFSEIKKGDFFTNHGFTNELKKLARIYYKNHSTYELSEKQLNIVSPIKLYNLKPNSEAVFCKNSKGEEITKLEAIAVEDLTDASFSPEK